MEFSVLQSWEIVRNFLNSWCFVAMGGCILFQTPWILDANMFAVFMLTQFSMYYAAQRVRERLVDNEVNCIPLNKPTQLNEFARNFIQFFSRKWNEDVTRVTYMLCWAVMIYSLRSMALFAASRRLFFSSNVLSTCCCWRCVIHTCRRMRFLNSRIRLFCGKTRDTWRRFLCLQWASNWWHSNCSKHLSVFFSIFYFYFLLYRMHSWEQH